MAGPLKTYTDRDVEVKDRLRELTDEDQNAPTLWAFFIYEGYKIGSVLLFTTFLTWILWSMLSDGYTRAMNYIDHLAQPEVVQPAPPKLP